MRRALKIVGFFIGLFISSIIILALLIDANMFKPRIAALAKDKGITLEMRGDLHWQFWPSIGLAVNDLYIASNNAPTLPIAQIQKASFLIAVIPLLRGDFQVKHVLVGGAIINLIVDEQGKGNWQDLQKSFATQSAIDKPLVDKSPKNTDGSITSNNLYLVIEKISLQHSVINYSDQTKNQRLALTDIDLNIAGINTQGNPFTVNFSGLAQLGKIKNAVAPLTIKSKLHGTMMLRDDLNSFTVSDGNLQLDIADKSSAAVAMKFSLEVDGLRDNLHYQGELNLSSFNAKKLLSAFGSQLKTANEKALDDVSIASKFDGNKTQLALSALQIKLDKTTLNGSAALTDFSGSAFTLNVQGDEINADDYLAPVTVATNSEINRSDASSPETKKIETEAADTKAAESKTSIAETEKTAIETNAPAVISNAAGDDVLLPLEFLRTLNAEITTSFNKVVFSALTLEKVQLDVEAKNGVVQQLLNANIYSGSIHESAIVDARNPSAQMKFEAILKSIELAPLLKAKKMDKDLNLSGAIHANASGQASGVSMKQMMESLTGTANFSGAKIRLAPLNIEQQFCKLVNVVNKVETPEKVWDAYTELRELSGKITVAKRIVTIETFNAGVEKLSLNASGKVNLANQEYDFLLPLKLIKDAAATEASTSAQGCSVGSNFWVERGMSLLRCKGGFANINPTKDCRPDKNALTALVKDYAEYKLREKHGEKLDAKKAELIKKLDDKLGGEGSAEKAKALLKNLFKKHNE